MWGLKFLKRRGAEDGVASIEFAFIAPALAFAIMGLVDVGMYLNARADMTDSVKSGVDYLLMGGQDINTAAEVVEHAWTSRPEYSKVGAERYCTCSGVVAVCSVSCSDGSQPETFKKIYAAAYYDGLLLRTKYSSDETIRIR